MSEAVQTSAFVTKGMRSWGQPQEKSEVLQTQSERSETEIHTLIQYMMYTNDHLEFCSLVKKNIYIFLLLV